MNREVAHTKDILDKYKSSPQKSAMRIFLTYLYCFENVKFFGRDLYGYDLVVLIKNFATYPITVRSSGSHRLNIFISLKKYFSYMRKKYKSNSNDTETNNIRDRLEGKDFLKKKIF